MQAATRRNLALIALGVLFLFLLSRVPGRQAPRTGLVVGIGTPRPTATVESHWRLLETVQASGSRNLCDEGRQITVPGPWRIRAVPADRAVEVLVYDKHNGQIFSRVWAGGTEHGELATLPVGNGTFCLQIKAEGDYTLLIEAWEAPQG